MDKKVSLLFFVGLLTGSLPGKAAEPPHVAHPGKGWANIGLYDSGIDYSHSRLRNALRRQFSTSLVPDETSANDQVHGHGTMVAGVMVADPAVDANGAPILPASRCPGCNLMVVRGVKTQADGPTDVGFAKAARWLAGSGAQVLNLSESLRIVGWTSTYYTLPTYLCGRDYSTLPSPMCSALQFLAARDIMVVAASGNGKGGYSDDMKAGISTAVGIPATEPGVIGVGGVVYATEVDSTANPLSRADSMCYRIDTPTKRKLPELYGVADCTVGTTCPGVSRWATWNEACFRNPVSYSGAITFGGSNYCNAGGTCESDYQDSSGRSVKGGRVDFAERSREVITTMIPGSAYVPGACDDRRLPIAGVDYCTGTSFAAPAISATIGLFRSANPLLSKVTVERALRIAAALEGGANYPGYTDKAGYGVPSRDTSIVFNTNYSNAIVNHLTPLFALTQTDASSSDRMYTAIPQVAVAAQFGELHLGSLVGSGAPYHSDAGTALVAGYGSFPSEATPTADNAPRASFDVFTMPTSPFGTSVTMQPLYRLSTVEGCANKAHKHIYSTDINEVNQLLAGNTAINCGSASVQTSYEYDGIEGFLMSGCPAGFAGCAAPNDAATPQCIHRRYSPKTDTWALIPERDLPAMQSAFPTSMGASCIGYSFVNTDTDGDTLIDGQERVIGTDPLNPNTDGDMLSDGQESPFANLPVSNPLDPASQP